MSKHPNQFEYLLQLIENVYGAALDEGRWRNLAPEIARTFGSTSTTLQIQRVGASSKILSMTDGEEDKYLVSQFLLPHLQRALRVRDQLSQAAVRQHISLETLNRCGTATFLVTADGAIIFANRTAEVMMTNGAGVRFCKGRLTAIRSTDAERLTVLIRAACGGATGCSQGDGVMTIRRVNQRPLSVLVAPFRLIWAGQPQAGAIVFVRDPNSSISATGTLRALFKLTPTEARIAQALANGETITEIAAAHRASLQTVRKQLRTIFAKTDTNRQAECVAVILRSIAAIARE
jgi:DNA-binding CsgD family transcriptional regulator